MEYICYSADLHAWIVIFILPINSAINPLLYTFTTPKFRERFMNEKWIYQIQNYFYKKEESSQGKNRRKKMKLFV